MNRGLHIYQNKYSKHYKNVFASRPTVSVYYSFPVILKSVSKAEVTHMISEMSPVLLVKYTRDLLLLCCL